MAISVDFESQKERKSDNLYDWKFIKEPNRRSIFVK